MAKRKQDGARSGAKTPRKTAPADPARIDTHSVVQSMLVIAQALGRPIDPKRLEEELKKLKGS